MTCPWRKLDADGVVLRCSEWGWCVREEWHFDPDRAVTWRSEDPCAWEATCPTCDGYGSTSPTFNASSRNCPTCGGAGTVDTIPAHLIGPSSTVATPVGGWHVAEVYDDGTLILVGVETAATLGEVVKVTLDRRGRDWTLTRPVPPAGGDL